MSHRVTELHSIMPIENIPSVMQHGILSHEQASQLCHEDISLSDVQDKRDSKTVPGGLKLHQYANLYFCARNPMLYKRNNHRDDLCVLRVSRLILNEAGVVLTDQNAASDYVSFYKSPQGLLRIDFDLVFAEYWTDGDLYEYWKKKRLKCAEVLVPHRVDSGHIEGAYVANDIAKANLENTGFGKPVTINSNMFFL